MPFPQTRQALDDNGYTLAFTKVCPSCNVTIEMWNTPNRNLMPLDFTTVDGKEICVPHFATCKNPAQYSRRLQKKAEAKKNEGPIIPDAA